MNSTPQPATAAPIHRHRPVLSVRNLLIAGAAVTLAAMAITPRSPHVQAAAVEAAAPYWADPAQHPANQDPTLSANRAAAAPYWADPAQHPANQDPTLSANRAGVAPTHWLADPALHPANQDPSLSASQAGVAPTLWWAEHR